MRGGDILVKNSREEMSVLFRVFLARGGDVEVENGCLELEVELITRE